MSNSASLGTLRVFINLLLLLPRICEKAPIFQFCNSCVRKKMSQLCFKIFLGKSSLLNPKNFQNDFFLLLILFCHKKIIILIVAKGNINLYDFVKSLKF